MGLYPVREFVSNGVNGEANLRQGYRRDGTTVDGLLTVAGITGVGVHDPCLVVPQLEDFGAEFAAESAADAQLLINTRGCHGNHSFQDGFCITIAYRLKDFNYTVSYGDKNVHDAGHTGALFPSCTMETASSATSRTDMRSIHSR